MIKFDSIGAWSEIKLEIIEAYAREYTKIFQAERQREAGFRAIYVDAFAGAGYHTSRTTGEPIVGSPNRALSVRPGFHEFHFIELDNERSDALRKAVEGISNAHVYPGDCNKVMLSKVIPQLKRNRMNRALVLLDPYGLQLDWEVIAELGSTGAVDLFLNFPVMDMNRNAFWSDPEGRSAAHIDRMNRFWGDASWQDVVYYETQPDLFEHVELKKHERADRRVVAAFRDRLVKVAGFSRPIEPLPMRNSTKAIVYYLFFASTKPVAYRIVEHLFNRHRRP